MLLVFDISPDDPVLLEDVDVHAVGGQLLVGAESYMDLLLLS